RVSFTVDRPLSQAQRNALGYGDQTVARLPKGGLVRWLGTRGELHEVITKMGRHHHFLYVSSGPSVGQWWLAHGAGGRLIAGAVKLDDTDDPVGSLRPGEVIEVTIAGEAQIQRLINELGRQLLAEVLDGFVDREPGTDRRYLEQHAGWLAEVHRAEVVAVDDRRGPRSRLLYALLPALLVLRWGCPGNVVDGSGALARGLLRR